MILLALACAAPPDEKPADSGPPVAFDVYRHVPTSELPAVREWNVSRGEIHVHSVYSHDACDALGFADADGNQNYVTGTMNTQCFEDLRAGLCDARLDWVFLTDHNDHYAEFEYPDVLLHTAADTLLPEGDQPAWAMRMTCPDGHSVLTSAGIDVDILGIGLRGHVAATPAERAAIYGARDATTVAAIQANGGLALGGYIPDWDESTFLAMNWDAIEVYNPVHNLRDRMTDVLTLFGRMRSEPDTVPVPELGLYAVFDENTTNLERWAQLAWLRRAPSFLGANAHRNVIVEPTWDGERLDAYRRAFHWFSNYALLAPGSEDDLEGLKAAIAAGRTYGAYDALGTPAGFDFVALSDGVTYDMGADVPLSGEVTLRVVSPTVAGLGPNDAIPEVRSRILRATADGTWEEVAAGEGVVEVRVTEAGPYRAEVRILPHHLAPFLGDPDTYLREVLWIYGNLVYVGMERAR